MKQQHLLVSYILIGLGVYFLMKQLDFKIFHSFYSWPTVLIIIGIAFLFFSFKTNQLDYIFTALFLLGIGIHFHGLKNYSFWIDHWSVYLLITGVAFLGRFFYTKKGFIQGIICAAIAILMLFSISLPESFQFIYSIIDFLETFWPVALILIGIYLYNFK